MSTVSAVRSSFGRREIVKYAMFEPDRCVSSQLVKPLFLDNREIYPKNANLI